VGTSKPQPKRILAIRLSPRDEAHIKRIIHSGWADNMSEAIRYALRATADKVAA